MTIHTHIVIPVKSFITLITFMEPVSFLVISFPNFHSHPSAPIHLAVYYMNFHLNRPLWPKHSKGRTMNSTYFKFKPSFYLFKAYIALESSANIFVFGWSMLSYHHCNTQQLCAPVFHSYGTSPGTSLKRCPTPQANIHLCPTLQVLKLAFFYFFLWAWDYPTVANIEPSSSAACIEALRSWSFYALTQACVVGSKPSRKWNIASCKLMSAHQMYLSLKPVI